MNRGDVYWYRFAPPDKRRPVVILTRSSALEYLTRVVVAAVTTRVRGIPSEVLLTPGDGMPEPSAVTLDNIYTVPVAALGERITTLSRAHMRAVREGIEFALGFSETP